MRYIMQLFLDSSFAAIGNGGLSYLAYTIEPGAFARFRYTVVHSASPMQKILEPLLEIGSLWVAQWFMVTHMCDSFWCLCSLVVCNAPSIGSQCLAFAYTPLSLSLCRLVLCQ